MITISPTQINYAHFNERDIEIPILLKTLSQKSFTTNSFLDVGAHYSWYHYAATVREILGSKAYRAVDILPCEKTEQIVDAYLIGNVCNLKPELVRSDFVACVSTIEHSGLSTYKTGDFRAEQNRVFETLVCLSNQCLFLSFPFGTDDVYPNEYANITEPQLFGWEEFAKTLGFKSEVQFWYNDFPQGKLLWNMISRSFASTCPMVKEKGTQCIGILILEK